MTDVKVTKNNLGQISLEFTNETSESYRLFMFLVRSQMSGTNDPSLKMFLTGLMDRLKSPSIESGATPAASVSDNGHLIQQMRTVSEKVDLVLKAIGNIHSLATTTEVKFDQEILDGFAKRVEFNLEKALSGKIESISIPDAPSIPPALVSDLKTLLQKVEEIKTIILSAASLQQVFTQQVASVSYANQVPEVPKVEIPEETTTAAVHNDIVRYPAKKKKVQPKCFGHFLPVSANADSPCPSCVYVNECSVVTKEEKKPQGIPACFGEYKHDLDCAECGVSRECMDKK